MNLLYTLVAETSLFDEFAADSKIYMFIFLGIGLIALIAKGINKNK